MDSEIRPHRTTAGTTTDLFICFASSFSSSSSHSLSMKISSKSILSPGRTDKFRDPSVAGPMSLSRRLRSNGSIKGGQASPMFPTGSKKRGSGFENPEPSSPKVTCIGQVRVKTKKKQQQGRKLRPTRSQRCGGGGEVSFRRVDQPPQQGNDGILSHSHSQECLRQRNNTNNNGNNQKWVHLPLTICEALRAFGAEFNCFLPCRSSSCGSGNERENGRSTAEGSREGGSSCGAAFARWLVSLQEGEGDGKGRDIELVVGERDEEDGLEERSWPRRRRRRGGGFGEIEFGDFEKCEILDEGEGEGEEGGRVTECVPPKNALLLMRCRSDPLRMSALANRLWESSVSKDDVVDDDEEEEESGNEKEEEEDGGNVEECEARGVKEELDVEKPNEGQSVDESWASGEEGNHQTSAEEAITVLMEEEEDEKEQTQERNLEISEIGEVNAGMEEEQERAEDSPEIQAQESDASEHLNILENEEDESLPMLKAEEEKKQETDEILESTEYEKEPSEEIDPSSSLVPVQSKKRQQEEVAVGEEVEEGNSEEETAQAQAQEEGNEKKVETLAGKPALETEAAEEKEPTNLRASPPENPDTATHHPGSDPARKSQITSHGSGGDGGLAESLLLQMRCEPKLSMEVSKETWVCSTDFIRRHRRLPPPPPDNPIDGGDEPRKSSAGSRPPQPPRSSCSLPAPPHPARASVSMATMIGEKLVNAVAYEPFVLTRCKSEPMRSASKLALPPDACFWKSRKVGAAGVGF